MFVRKRKNKAGSTSVVVVSKHGGNYVEVKNFGTVRFAEDVDRLVLEAKHWIETYGGQQLLDFDNKRRRELEETERVVGNMDALLINGTQLLLDRIWPMESSPGWPESMARDSSSATQRSAPTRTPTTANAA